MRIVLRRNLPMVIAAGVAVLALAAVGFAVVWRAQDQAAIDEAVCEQAVAARDDNRAVWERVRAYLLSQSPEDRQRFVNEFIDDVLLAIPKLECRDRKPVEVKGATS